MKFIGKICWLMLAFCLLLGCGCRKKERMKLQVIAENLHPPFCYTEGENVIGIDMEVLRLICERLDCDYEIKYVNFESVLEMVRNGEADIGIGGITETDERKKRLEFSEPYTKEKIIAVVRSDSEIRDTAKLQDSVIGAKNGSTHFNYTESNLTVSVEGFANHDTAITALIEEKIEAVVMDYSTARAYIARYGTLTTLDSVLNTENIAFALRKNRDDDLNQRINKVMKQLKKEGLLQQIVKKYEKSNNIDDKKIATRRLHVLVDPTTPPYVYRDAANNIVGADVDLLRLMAEKMGYSVVFEPMPRDLSIPALLDGTGDIAVGNTKIPTKWRSKVSCSKSFRSGAMAAIVPNDSNLKSIEELKDPKIITGAMFSGSSQGAEKQLIADPEYFADITFALQKLRNNEIHAFVMDRGCAQIVTNEGKERILSGRIQSGDFAIVIPTQKAEELLPGMNKILKEMVDSGVVSGLLERHTDSVSRGAEK